MTNPAKIPHEENASAASEPASSPLPPPHVQDATVLSLSPPDALPTSITSGPLQLADIGRALQGQHLEHFRLEEFIGGGGMGAVFRATDTQLERSVAVKVLTHRYGHEDDTVRRFRVEAQSAARLNHENIATVFYVGEDKGWNFIAFEFIEGENLRDIVTRLGPLSLPLAVSCIAQLADALSHASQRDVVHRDIKPSNVLMTPTGKAKLVDMGLARLRQVESPDDDLTMSGVTLGTFDYISPEQGRDPRDADVRSDLYSLGCTFYYMLTGQPPYPTGTVLQKLLSHTSDPPPNPRVLRPDLPEDIAAIVLKLLAKLPKHRYQTPDELTWDLAQAAHRNQLQVTVASPHLPPVKQRPGRLLSSLPWLIPAAVLIVLALGVDWFATVDSSSSTLPHFRQPATLPQPATSIPPATSFPFSPLDASPRVKNQDVPLTVGPNKVSPVKPAAAPPSKTAVPSQRPDDSPVATEVLSTRDAPGNSSPLFPRGAPARSANLAATQASVTQVAVIPPGMSTADDQIAAGTRVTASLAEAIRQAASAQVNQIVLFVDGVLPLEPIRIEDMDLTIRAADGCEPILQFTPTMPSEALGMISMKGSSVAIDGVHFQLDLQSMTGCLFDLERMEYFNLTNSWIQVIGNATLPDAELTRVATVLNIRDQEPSVLSYLGDEPKEPLPTVVNFRNCAICGDTTVLSMPAAGPLRFVWSNGFFASSQAMFFIGGTEQPSSDGELLKIDLDHLTSVSDRGLCRAWATSRRTHLMTIDINATRSLFIIADTEPFIESMGYDADEMKSHILYSGERNFYEGLELFWQQSLKSTTSDLVEQRTQMRIDEWQRRWETTERSWHRNKVQWASEPDPFRQRHELKPPDYALSPAPNNPARRGGGGTDRRDAGFILGDLPEIVVSKSR